MGLLAARQVFIKQESCGHICHAISRNTRVASISWFKTKYIFVNSDMVLPRSAVGMLRIISLSMVGFMSECTQVGCKTLKMILVCAALPLASDKVPVTYSEEVNQVSI